VEYLGVSSGCGRDASAPEGCDRPCLCSSRAIGRRVLGFGLDHVADDAASRLGAIDNYRYICHACQVHHA
jgi:hypothetical protein